MISILIIEHPPAVRRTLVMRLAVEPDLQVVGEADNLDSAVSQVQTLHPRVIVLDAEMPDLDLGRVVERLSACAPASALVILALNSAALQQVGSGKVTVV